MNYDELIKDPTPAGFTWGQGPVSYNKSKGNPVLLSDKAPHATVTDVEKFEAAFPGVILASLDGTSIKVLCQGVSRRILKAEPTLQDFTKIKTGILDAIRGVKARPTAFVTQKVYVVNGEEFTSLEDAQRAEIAYLVDLGVPAEVATQKVLSR